MEARVTKKRYAGAPHLVIEVDDVPLNVTLDMALPSRQLVGLVPALLDWLSDPIERAVVWDRILPNHGNSAHAPILMCPDDCDLWCSVVIADVFHENQSVWWRRLGVDCTKEDLPSSVGTNVEWIDGLGPYCFALSDYQRCIASFRQNGVWQLVYPADVGRLACLDRHLVSGAPRRTGADSSWRRWQTGGACGANAGQPVTEKALAKAEG